MYKSLHGQRSLNPAREPRIVRLGAGVGMADLAVETSECGQYVMLMCGGSLLALVGAMGSDIESVEFADRTKGVSFALISS
jgi:hypothetical protein